ncbi:MAG TPA: formimidoylglutamate deiminase [Solirubrobacteraceae bacterium]|nr:formimidoylglutamate deiminase [Solirubrobacteraceae bacterium]
MTALWCEWAWLGGGAATADVSIEIDEAAGRIADVRAGAEPSADAEQLRGLTIPGLANAHSHAFQRALRGRAQGPGSFWSWREQMLALAETVDPDGYRALARATFAEMALAGVTVVGEFHYLHHGPGGEPYADPNELGRAVLAAADEAGIRIVLLDACYLHGGSARFRDASEAAWAERVSALDGATVGAAIHSVRAVDPDAAAVVAGWAAARSAPLHAHVSEQPAENERTRERWGLTPTALLGEAGALSERFTAIHATHVSAADIGLLGGAGATVCLCPTTERDLADGIGPARRLTDAGARLALGSDSHAVIDLLEEARAVELDERLACGERGRHGADELLRAATTGGYASLGLHDGGRIEAGALADLTAVALDSVRLAGTPPLDGVVFCAGAADVRDVMVGGRWLVRDGAHVSIDVAAELREVLSP